jgi:hypothetical protein
MIINIALCYIIAPNFNQEAFVCILLWPSFVYLIARIETILFFYTIDEEIPREGGLVREVLIFFML